MTSSTPEPGKVVVVSTIPGCNFCADGTPGPYDFRTVAGPWANGCEIHWLQYRAEPELGVGKAQLWVLPSEPGYDAMSDRDLAVALRAAEGKTLDAQGNVAEEIIGLQNVICDRLDIPLDETERGLSQAASDRIDAYIEEHVEPDPGDHPDADRPPGTSGSWGEA